MAKVSGVIITHNEEKKIRRCIESLRKVAEDIVVVDSFSSDGTMAICLEENVRFYQREFTTYADQKNFASRLAKYDHIISLDADEYLSDELVESINSVTESWTIQAFSMNRLSSYSGKWIHHGSWYPDRQTRMWNKMYGKWGGSNPHEKLKLLEGNTVIKLKGDLLHESYEDASKALDKIQLYSKLYAEFNVGLKHPTVASIIIHTAFAFFKSYVMKRGFLDGFEGLMVAAGISNHTFYKYAKLYEANKRAMVVRQETESSPVLRIPDLMEPKKEEYVNDNIFGSKIV